MAQPDITPVSNSRCVHRGVSIMRLALGYRSGLPDDWWYKPSGGLGDEHGCRDEIRQIRQAFPEHTVLVGCRPAYGGIWGLSVTEYTDWSDFLACMHEHIDDYIFAFSYYHNGGQSLHFVVGNPTFSDHHTVAYAVAVSIEKEQTPSLRRQLKG